MNIQKAALNVLRGLGDYTDKRDPEGKTVAHAYWMLQGIAQGYIQHEKAHRWLGYAQGIIVAWNEGTLDEMKLANKLTATTND